MHRHTNHSLIVRMQLSSFGVLLLSPMPIVVSGSHLKSAMSKASLRVTIKTGRRRRPTYVGCLAIDLRIQFNPANRHVGNSNHDISVA